MIIIYAVLVRRNEDDHNANDMRRHVGGGGGGYGGCGSGGGVLRLIALRKYVQKLLYIVYSMYTYRGIVSSPFPGQVCEFVQCVPLHAACYHNHKVLFTKPIWIIGVL